MKVIQVPDLEQFKFNGVINIGANTGEYAKCYYDLGISSVVWIDKNANLDGVLYQATKNFGMRQQYYFTEINNLDTEKSKRFKSFWRMNAADIDIETYDLLHIDVKNNVLNVLSGFENLFTNFRAIILTQHHGNESKNYIENHGYESVAFSDIGHTLYVRK